MKFLFAKKICKANDKTKIKIYAGRSGKFICKFMQINAVYLDKFEDINNLIIRSITVNGCSQVENFDDIEIPISFFENEKLFHTSSFASHENKGLIIEIENPNNFDVSVYISLKGEAVAA